MFVHDPDRIKRKKLRNSALLWNSPTTGDWRQQSLRATNIVSDLSGSFSFCGASRFCACRPEAYLPVPRSPVFEDKTLRSSI